MATNIIIEKYNNLNEEENLMNNYIYRPINIKNSELIQLKKPKKFFVNKLIENFRTNKRGNLKTLREFQNLYIHKFLLHKKKEEETKNRTSLFSPNCKKIKFKNIDKENSLHYNNNEFINNRPSSTKNFLKVSNLFHKKNNKINYI
jgi:threonyl-tRNA synthetase